MDNTQTASAAVPASPSAKKSGAAVKSVVLVHGAWVDGTGWFDVYKILTEDGYDVTVVQNPLTSLADDVAATRRAISAATGRVILVGHSYGGVVVTEAGTDAKVAGVVYIAAFVPDAGESVETLIANPASGAPSPPILPPRDGYLLLDRARFIEAFAADVRTDLASFMAASQVPWSMDAFSGTVTDPAWRVKPSRYLIASDDRMIPPAAQRSMANRIGGSVEEASGSHAIYVSRPDVVAAVIKAAAHDAGS